MPQLACPISSGSTVLNQRRSMPPVPSSSTSTSKKALPKDAVSFAKKLGVDLAGLEPEAAEIWKQLEQLSTADPVEYERFVAQQMQLAKEDEEAAKTTKKKEDKSRAFRPDGKSIPPLALSPISQVALAPLSSRV